MSISGYGTISEEDPDESSNKQFLSRTKEQIQTILGTAKPWKDMMQPSRLTCPFSFCNTIRRMKSNARVYSTNYVVLMLSIVLLTLLWHPICVIVFCALMAAWMLLYFIRDKAVRVLGYEMDDRLVAVLLVVVTVGLIYVSDVRVEIIVGVGVGAFMVLLHTVMRETEEEEEEDEALGGIRLRHAASSSFTT